MRTFNVTFPLKFVDTIQRSYAFVSIVCLVGFICDLFNNGHLFPYFISAFFITSLFYLIILIGFKKHLTSKGTINLYADRIVVKGPVPEEILFKEISGYKCSSFSYRGMKGVSLYISLMAGNKFSMSGSAANNDNLAFIDALNQEIEPLIKSGEIKVKG